MFNLQASASLFRSSSKEDLPKKWKEHVHSLDKVHAHTISLGVLHATYAFESRKCKTTEVFKVL